jgi:hypothetical protein
LEQFRPDAQWNNFLQLFQGALKNSFVQIRQGAHHFILSSHFKGL